MYDNGCRQPGQGGSCPWKPAPPTARSTDDRSTTGTWGWIAITAGTVALSVPADLLISLVYTSSCGQPGTPQNVWEGRLAMALELLFAPMPAVGFVLYGFTADAWSTSGCVGG